MDRTRTALLRRMQELEEALTKTAEEKRESLSKQVYRNRLRQEASASDLRELLVPISLRVEQLCEDQYERERQQSSSSSGLSRTDSSYAKPF